MSTLDRLQAIANRAGRPTMDYAPEIVLREQRESLDVTYIAHGGAQGADRLAGEVAREEQRIAQKVYRADWDRHGKRAGLIRNVEMLNDFKPDVVLAVRMDACGASGRVSQGRAKVIRRLKCVGCYHQHARAAGRRIGRCAPIHRTISMATEITKAGRYSATGYGSAQTVRASRSYPW